MKGRKEVRKGGKEERKEKEREERTEIGEKIKDWKV